MAMTAREQLLRDLPEYDWQRRCGSWEGIRNGQRELVMWPGYCWVCCAVNHTGVIAEGAARTPGEALAQLRSNIRHLISLGYAQ